MTSVDDVREGDYVKVKGQWLEIQDMSRIYSAGRLRSWLVGTELGVHDMYEIQLYATRAEFMDARSTPIVEKSPPKKLESAD